VFPTQSYSPSTHLHWLLICNRDAVCHPDLGITTINNNLLVPFNFSFSNSPPLSTPSLSSFPYPLPSRTYCPSSYPIPIPYSSAVLYPFSSYSRSQTLLLPIHIPLINLCLNPLLTATPPSKLFPSSSPSHITLTSTCSELSAAKCHPVIWYHLVKSAAVEVFIHRIT